MYLDNFLLRIPMRHDVSSSRLIDAWEFKNSYTSIDSALPQDIYMRFALGVYT
ncbi:hypothetical protein ALP00_200013 [Pseudomonas coronafaciens pv. porri]|nr:hypothetical protein ALP00_200013 [Pseudomonas coronafaciens pv. porri]